MDSKYVLYDILYDDEDKNNANKNREFYVNLETKLKKSFKNVIFNPKRSQLLCRLDKETGKVIKFLV